MKKSKKKIQKLQFEDDADALRGVVDAKEIFSELNDDKRITPEMLNDKLIQWRDKAIKAERQYENRNDNERAAYWRSFRLTISRNLFRIEQPTIQDKIIQFKKDEKGIFRKSEITKAQPGKEDLKPFFKSVRACELFERLRNETKGKREKQVIYSCIFYAMQDAKLIYSNVKSLEFVKALKLDVPKLHPPVRTRKSKHWKTIQSEIRNVP